MLLSNRRWWEREAGNWLAWARTPGHDAYWYYRESFFDRIVPPPGRWTVEIGCGEGRVTRDLTGRGHRVVSLDGSQTLVAQASAVDPAGRYALADAIALPLATGSAELVIAYNSLMDFDDMPGAVREMGRVLRRGGALCICVTHPLFDTGVFEGEGPDAPYLLRDSYFGSRPFDQTVERDGLTMRFRGWSRSLEEYLSALTEAGFVVDALREPKPEPGLHDAARWQRFPMFLQLRAIRS